MINAISHYFVVELEPSQEIWTGKEHTCALFAEVYFLNHILDFRILRSSRIDKVVRWKLIPLLLVAKVEGIVVVFDKILQARVVDLGIKI